MDVIRGLSRNLLRVVPEATPYAPIPAAELRFEIGDALRGLGRFLDEAYSRKRIHSSLGYLTPAEYESLWREKHSARA